MKKRRRRKNKKLIIAPEAPISIEQNKEETTIEKLKLIGYWIIGITVVLSIFSGFKYPWKWIDALYETENERFGLLGVNHISWVPISSLDWYAPHSYVLGE